MIVTERQEGHWSGWNSENKYYYPANKFCKINDNIFVILYYPDHMLIPKVLSIDECSVELSGAGE